MTFREFDLPKVQHDFGLALDTTKSIFPGIAPVPLSDELAGFWGKVLPLGLALITEKARSELITAPLLAEVWHRSNRQIALLSGVDWVVDDKVGLNGVADFLLCRSPIMLYVTAPVLVAVEAKRDSIPDGLGQCAAEMVAAQARSASEEPPRGADSMSTEPTTPERIREQVRDRVQWPAMFLIASAALNLLVALFQTARFVTVVVVPADEVYRSERDWWEKLAPGSSSPVIAARLESLRQTDPEELKRQNVFSAAIFTVLLLLPALLALAGGVRMYQLRSYPLAVVGSLALAAPCLSPMTCCCIGEVVGVWCIVVLIQPPVRDAFR